MPPIASAGNNYSQDLNEPTTDSWGSHRTFSGGIFSDITGFLTDLFGTHRENTYIGITVRSLTNIDRDVNENPVVTEENSAPGFVHTWCFLSVGVLVVCTLFYYVWLRCGRRRENEYVTLEDMRGRVGSEQQL